MSSKTSKHYILTGLFSIFPITATYWIEVKLFKFFSKPGSTIVEIIFSDKVPLYIPELAGFVLTILFIYIIGLLVSNVLGKRVYLWMEGILSRVTVVNIVYRTIKQITTSISGPERQAFKKVVFIEYPRNGIWTLTMVTGESTNKDGEKYYHIFVPTTPNPTSGYMLYIPQKDTQKTNMSIEEGLKIIISGGMLAPNKNLLEANDGINEEVITEEVVRAIFIKVLNIETLNTERIMIIFQLLLNNLYIFFNLLNVNGNNIISTIRFR